MDLPKMHPAGSEFASAFAGDGDGAPPENLAVTGENVAAAPAIRAGEPTHANFRGQPNKKSGSPGRKRTWPFVLWTKRPAMDPVRDGDSTEDGLGRRETRVHSSSPDAQGQKIMIKRNLTSIGAIAGVGVLSLALHSCGQKPAPAETAEGAAKAPETGDVQAMRVTRVAQRDLSEEVVATGNLVIREEAAVGSELSGFRVAAVYVDEGDWVKQGQALAKLDDTLLQAQIAQAEATLATEKANVDFKQSQLDRAEMLTAEGAFSKEQLEQRRMEAVGAKASLLASQAAVNEMKVRSSRMTLRAPVAGSVLQRSIRPGEISGAATAPYFRIARDGLIELDAELPDSKLAQIKIGDPAQVQLSTGETIQGKVRFISPRVDVNTGLGRARIELPFDKALRPGSFAQARFNGSSTGMLTVPASAIRYEAGGPSVMLVGEGNKVSRVPVKLGERTGDFVQLVEGPPAGSRVLTVGAAFTLDGDVIEPVEEGVASSTAATPGGK
jgi:HlyD family secretion protein